jgi:aspartate/methionine/tyrosine aminotransferase
MVGRGPPREVLATLVAAGKAAGAADPTRDANGPVQGDPELLAMLAAALGQEQGIDLHGGDLWVMAGSNMAFNAIAQVVCDGPPAEPSELILPLPWYFNYVMAA